MTDTLRVATWDDFIGQTQLKERLTVHIDAARNSGNALEHILLFGPPGFGKTSLAAIIATKLELPFTQVSMPLDERAFRTLVQQNNGVILLDEIHRASKGEQESLLPLLEFGYLTDKMGRRVYSDHTTFIGATTEREKVIAPLFDRFGIVPDFDDYSDEEMGRIVASMARRAGVSLKPKQAQELGRATGGIPRRARQYVLAARDLIATGKTPTASDVLALCRVDETGLTEQHRQYLRALNRLGGVAGLSPLQNTLRLNETVVRDMERLLLKQDLINYTERGRELTTTGFRKVGEFERT